MEFSKFERQIKLMTMLAQNREYTVHELAERMGISWRSVYRYLDFFKDIGLVVEHNRNIWRIDRRSQIFRDLTGRVQFSDSEAAILRHILEGVTNNTQARLLTHKLCRIYDMPLVDDDITSDEHLANNIEILQQAAAERRIVILRDYRSANSDSISDRYVEPFQFINGAGEVRCFEISSKQCKTFKTKRIGSVEMVDLNWSYANLHEILHTDAFGFSGTDQTMVSLRLTTLSIDLLKEEYPRAIAFLNDNVLKIPVCSFLGIGRFVMGLPDACEVLSPTEFRKYLQNKTQLLKEKLDKSY